MNDFIDDYMELIDSKEIKRIREERDRALAEFNTIAEPIRDALGIEADARTYAMYIRGLRARIAEQEKQLDELKDENESLKEENALRKMASFTITGKVCNETPLGEPEQCVLGTETAQEAEERAAAHMANIERILKEYHSKE